MSSSSFGQWYENQRAGGGSEGGSTGSNLFASIQALGDTENLLPMFNTEAMQNMSFSSMKATMEAQMPQQIMGMGYQQRFKVNSEQKNSLGCNVLIMIFDEHVPDSLVVFRSFALYCSYPLCSLLLLFLSACP